MSTLDLNVKTNQEAFDTVVRHLATMKRRAINDAETCLYRAPDGSKCAVGALITDESWDALPEADARNYNRHLVCLLPIDFGDISLALLSDLQQAHDNSDNWGDHFEGGGFINPDALRKVGRWYELNLAQVDTSFPQQVTA